VRGAHLIACCAPPVLLAVDFAVLSVAVPQLRRELTLSDTEVLWLFSAYNVAFGCLLLAAGRAADRYGRRRMLLAGLTVFAVAAAVTAAAGGAVSVIAGRVAQGAGAALMTPAALSLLTAATSEGEERSRVLAAYGLAISLGFVTGTLITGVLATLASWRPAVATTTPLAAAAIVAARRLPPDETALRGGAAARAEFRPPVLAVTGLVAAAALGAAYGGAGLILTVAAATALLALAARLGRRMAIACGAGLVVTATGVAGTVLLTLYLQDVRGYSPLAAGAVFACFGAAAIPGAATARRLRPGRGVVTGLAAQGGGLLAAGSAGPAPAVVASVAGFGFGHVIGNASVAAVATARAAQARHGELAGMLITAQYLGGALGPSVLGRASFQAGMMVAGTAAVAAAAITWWLDAAT